MRQTVFLVLALLTLVGCKRIVEIESPYPTLVEFCDVDDPLVGYWQSDSVRITTEVDTLDSLIVNSNPTVFYDLTVRCADDNKRFLLEYINFSGVVTREVHSTNYESSPAAFYVYDALTETRDTSKAEFILRYESTSDSTITARYFQELGQGQRSWYRLHFRKVEE